MLLERGAGRDGDVRAVGDLAGDRGVRVGLHAAIIGAIGDARRTLVHRTLFLDTG